MKNTIKKKIMKRQMKCIIIIVRWLLISTCTYLLFELYICIYVSMYVRKKYMNSTSHWITRDI